MLTRLTPLQLTRAALLGVVIYGTFSASALFNPRGPHEHLINLALIPMVVGLILFAPAYWRVMRGLSRKSYTLDQLKRAEIWVSGETFRWPVRVIIAGGIAGVLYTTFMGLHRVTIFTSLFLFGSAVDKIKGRILEAVKPEPELTLQSRRGSVHGLHSDHWGSQGSS